MGIGELWDALVSAVCRPPRDSQYTVEDLLGGSKGQFSLNQRGYTAHREDLVLINKRGLKLQCSWYQPDNVQGLEGKLPCVIYCHCNSGSRRDCEEAIFQLLPNGVTVFALDFAGSGLSEGECVTLGAHEVDDVEVAVQHLRSCGKVSLIGLWGRSMGAVTALLYSQRDPSIAGMVLDSPFSCLTDLMMELVAEQELPIPKPLMKMALACMKRSVRKRAGFDITEVAPINVVKESFIPALFCHATGDTFIKIHHSERLHEAYGGDKNFVKVDGDHNSARPRFFKDSVVIFFTNTLQLHRMIVSGNSTVLEYKQLGGGIGAAAQAAAEACADGGSQALALSHSTSHPGHGGIPWELQGLRSANSIPRLPTSTSAGEGGEPGPPNGTVRRGGAVRTHGPSRGALAGPAPARAPGDLQGAVDADQDALEEAQFEAMLEAAMQASLLEQHSKQASKGASPQDVASNLAPGSNYAASIVQNGHAAEPLTAASRPGRNSRPSGGVVAAPAPRTLRGLMPSTEEDEEAMLQQAIAMSLQESGPAAATPSTSGQGPAAVAASKQNAVTGAVGYGHNAAAAAGRKSMQGSQGLSAEVAVHGKNATAAGGKENVGMGKNAGILAGSGMPLSGGPTQQPRSSTGGVTNVGPAVVQSHSSQSVGAPGKAGALQQPRSSQGGVGAAAQPTNTNYVDLLDAELSAGLLAGAIQSSNAGLSKTA